MPEAYDSKHTGTQIDSLQGQIDALNATLSNISNNLSNVGITLTNFNNLSNTVSSIQSNYATKAQVNTVIYMPNNTYQDITLVNSAKKTAWTTALSDWSPPSNGWLTVYLNNASSTPAASITGGGIQARQAGNGTREFVISMPVKPSSTYAINYIYCAVAWARFIPALQL